MQAPQSYVKVSCTLPACKSKDIPNTFGTKPIPWHQHVRLNTDSSSLQHTTSRSVSSSGPGQEIDKPHTACCKNSDHEQGTMPTRLSEKAQRTLEISHASFPSTHASQPCLAHRQFTVARHCCDPYYIFKRSSRTSETWRWQLGLTAFGHMNAWYHGSPPPFPKVPTFRWSTAVRHMGR
jgi:hypothetical protein